MAGEEDKSCDYYAVLELKKECTSAELRHAYKKLALVRIQNYKFYFFFYNCVCVCLILRKSNR